MDPQPTARGHEYKVYDDLFRKAEFLREEFDLTLTQIGGLLDTLAQQYKERNLEDRENPELQDDDEEVNLEAT